LSLFLVICTSGKRRKLLAALVGGPEDVHDKDSLIENIWHKHTTATHHSLHNLKDELDEALDDTTLIETITGVGYAFTAPVMRLEPDRTAASGNGLGPKMLPIFPGIGTPAGSLFVHSAADSGKNDHVKYIKRKVKWEARPRQMVLTSEDARCSRDNGYPFPTYTQEKF
jgi:hypothetical protein